LIVITSVALARPTVVGANCTPILSFCPGSSVNAPPPRVTLNGLLPANAPTLPVSTPLPVLAALKPRTSVVFFADRAEGKRRLRRGRRRRRQIDRQLPSGAAARKRDGEGWMPRVAA